MTYSGPGLMARRHARSAAKTYEGVLTKFVLGGQPLQILVLAQCPRSARSCRFVSMSTPLVAVSVKTQISATLAYGEFH